MRSGAAASGARSCRLLYSAVVAPIMSLPSAGETVQAPDEHHIGSLLNTRLILYAKRYLRLHC